MHPLSSTALSVQTACYSGLVLESDETEKAIAWSACEHNQVKEMEGNYEESRKMLQKWLNFDA